LDSVQNGTLNKANFVGRGAEDVVFEKPMDFEYKAGLPVL
jgi:hypothetical protein